MKPKNINQLTVAKAEKLQYPLDNKAKNRFPSDVYEEVEARLTNEITVNLTRNLAMPLRFNLKYLGEKRMADEA